MKLFLMLFSFFVSIQVSASNSYVDISGVYSIDQTSAMRFTQNDNVSLKIEIGEIKENGKIHWHKNPIKTQLNGSPTCDAFGCIAGHVDLDHVQISRDKSWLAYSPIHGYCDYNSESYSFSDDGNLNRRKSVFNCQDGYVGILETLLQPLNKSGD